MTGSLSVEELEALEDTAKELRGGKAAAKIADQAQGLIRNVSIIGTILTAFGAATTLVTFDGSGPVVPALVVPGLAIASSIFAAVAVFFALKSSLGKIRRINPYNLLEVKTWLEEQAEEKSKDYKRARQFLLWSVGFAVFTLVVAGGWLVFNSLTSDGPRGPRNLAALSSATGQEGAVAVSLTGAVDNVDENDYLLADITSGNATIASVQAHPDGDGKATLDLEAQAPVGSTAATATVQVMRPDGADEDSDPDLVAGPFTYQVSYPEVPAKQEDTKTGTGV